jgi:3-hydroxybutyryl-CoA dehydratase
MEAIGVGSSYEQEFVIDDAMIRRYAEAVGDQNPLHLDDAFATSTPFGRRIAHGGILFGLFSRILGVDFPGAGTVFLRQVIEFSRPVYVDDRVKVRLEIAELLPKNGARLAMQITRGADVLSKGEATIKLPLPQKG